MKDHTHKDKQKLSDEIYSVIEKYPDICTGCINEVLIDM